MMIPLSARLKLRRRGLKRKITAKSAKAKANRKNRNENVPIRVKLSLTSEKVHPQARETIKRIICA